ncbi:MULTISPECIES: glycosyltransferase family 4 protein [unclassified Modestobacter]|uniref:glycosyltransferase family 4 protein n=1 Tax=unclassified Modestobacter TaxID=2643866 RepID=UPI0022AB2259|nr:MULTISPECIES: glycosyltransferase family 1 protein [unclassified Modestobacter]MCZ2823778.1 glycosyltransferase family 1 protein [Modestobacter sp. VKM Ac-2981]MCZ2852023.1 glycosyltransferase family 1 protein [Modestobacter sp. VKM Ac-2982]
MTSAAALPDVSAAEESLAVLHQRLQVTAQTLGLESASRAVDPAVATSELYGRLVEHVHAQLGTEALWLLLTAMGGAMPGSDEVLGALRARDLMNAAEFSRWLLEAGHAAAWHAGAADVEMDVVADAVVVDVDFSARYNLHTGIQRVVRETVPRWAQAHDLTLVAWTEAGGAMRRIADFEEDRVLRWGRTVPPPDGTPPAERQRLVVPWRSSVLLPENPSPTHCPALAAAARFSGNTVNLIGYDCIPAISPDLIQTQLPDRFMRYLETVKHASRVAGISAAATGEFRGFGDMLAAQGLPGPVVTECALPVEVPAGEPTAQLDPPLVLCIGSFEPRKNQLAVLHAAERLWRTGLRFQVEFVGGSGWVTEFDDLLNRLRSAGRPVRRRTAISDAELWRTMRRARFSVFVSLHEGFGLPVAESLACGTPCLTSDFGSTRELAEEGGAVVVDPRDDLAIAAQMRRLLTDDDLIAELRLQASRRPPRTWDDYARELWDALVSAGRSEVEIR